MSLKGEEMEAKITYVNPTDGAENIEVNGHDIQFGGGDGDGYCYSHQSFDCVENLSEEEEKAIFKAKK